MGLAAQDAARHGNRPRPNSGVTMGHFTHIDLAERRNRPLGQPFTSPRCIMSAVSGGGISGSSSCRLEIATLAPALGSARAMALPSSLLPPVTRAVRLERSKSVVDTECTPNSFASMSKSNG
jgi:hypothetical protein